MEEMVKSTLRNKRKTACIVMLTTALLVLLIHSRSLGASEHIGSYNAGVLFDREHMVGFNMKESGKTTSVVMENRLDRLNKYCDTIRKDRTRDPSLDPPGELIVNEKYQIIYCNVPKVGCTNWKTVFLKIGGIDDIRLKAIQRLPTNIRGRMYLDYFYKYDNISHRQYMLRTFTKFVFARHPFTRILSAFRNKLAPNLTSQFHPNPKPKGKRKSFDDVNWVERYGIPIIEKYRGAEEAKFILQNWRTKYDLKFSEFVSFLIDTNPLAFDKHWSPISTLCRPCDVRYNIIGKYETLDNDAEYILRTSNIDPSVKYPASDRKATNSSSVDILRRYYREISREQLQKLYEVYKTDFELFDYSLESFFKYLS